MLNRCVNGKVIIISSKYIYEKPGNIGKKVCEVKNYSSTQLPVESIDELIEKAGDILLDFKSNSNFYRNVTLGDVLKQIKNISKVS